MRRCSCRVPSALLVALLAGAPLPTLAQPGADWFGPACEPSSAIMPKADQLLWISVHTAPDLAGEPMTILQTADGRAWVTPTTLLQWQVPVPAASRVFEGERWVALQAVPGLRHRLDVCTQALWVDVALARPDRRRFDLMPTAAPAGGAPLEPGGYLNLDAQLTRALGMTHGSALGELGYADARGYGTASFIAGTDYSVRLDTAWNHDNPERMERLTLGDTITRSSTFGQALRLGGVQWGRQFALRPDLITYPLPSFGGRAALASSVDVYVDQTLRASQPVPAGPFELNQVPVIVGQGEVQLVVRDVLGREQVLTYPFYTAPTLLRAGLDDYTVSAGWLRNRYAVASFDYGSLVLSGTYRKGLTDHLTGEVYGETLREQQMLSGALTWMQESLGVFTAGLAASGSAHGNGVGTQLGFERIERLWSFAAEWRRADPGFRRAGEGINALRRSELLRLGLVPHEGGSLSLSHLHQVRDGADPVSITGLTYGYSFARDWTLFVNANRVESADISHSVLVGFNWQFGANLLASAQWTQSAGDSRGRLTLQRSPQNALDYGWQISTEQGQRPRYDAQGRLGTERGTISAQVERSAGDDSYRLGYNTAIAVLGWDGFWTRPVAGSFAVVETAGVPDVRVYADERLVGRTDAAGQLLVPDIRTYEPTRLRIEDADVPIEYEIGAMGRPVSPRTRGAVRVPIAVQRSAVERSLKLRLPDGEFVPAGARIYVDGVLQDLPVGFEGQALLSHPEQRPRIEAAWADHRCVVRWPEAPTAETAVCEDSSP